jgi:hypothetical protein
MNAPAINAQPITSVNIGKTRLVGKIYARNRKGNTHYTQIISPAKDEYSMPSKFGLRSKTPLGEIGDTVNLMVHISGSSREFSFVDKDTGDRKTGHDNSVYLDVAE